MKPKIEPLVRYTDKTDAVDCPYGNVRRVVTGGEGGLANVHVVRVTRGSTHYHRDYDEVYYVLSGRGKIIMTGDSGDSGEPGGPGGGSKRWQLRPGAVAVIPRGVAHEIIADDGQELEFIIFGTPPMSIDDPRARPLRPGQTSPGKG